MNDIAKCPVCNESPNVLTLHDNTDIITYVCCGYSIVGLKRWNKYAAAMALAKAIYMDANCEITRTEVDLAHARERVLEIF